MNYFCNGNYKGTSITALDIINQDVGGIILTGSGKSLKAILKPTFSQNNEILADGIVRLFRNYDPTLEQGPLQMVSSFRGLNEVIQLQKGSGLVLDWKQSTGSLLVGGDSRVIKVWDAQTETQSLVRYYGLPEMQNHYFFYSKCVFDRIWTRIRRVR